MATGRFIASKELEKSPVSVLKQVSDSGEPHYITHDGKAQAVLIDINRYNAMLDLVEEAESLKDNREEIGDQTRQVTSVRGIIRRSSRFRKRR